MAFLIGGANSDSGAYQINNSLRFDDGSSCKLEFDTSGDGTATKGTISLWVKRASLDVMSNGSDALVYAVNDSENYSFLRFDDADKLDFYNITSNTLRQRFVTNRLFRDITAWYHIVLAFDVSQASSSDGIKIYVNGVLETSFGTSTYNQNQATNFFLANADWKIGVDASGGSFYDGYMSNVEAITNQQLAATDFGESNDNGVWVPIKTSHTAGTNGFKLEFKQTGTSANASGIGADTSGNDNHFTPTNLAAIDVTTDTPSNNFATLNPLDAGSEGTLSEGNTKYTGGTTSGSGELQMAGGTFGVSNGKWYFEVKRGANDSAIGIYAAEHGTVNIGYNNPFVSGWNGYSHFVYTSDGNARSGNANTSYGGAVHDGDIIGVALDLDNGAIYYSDNGTWMDSGDPTSGASKTGAASNFPTGPDTWILGFIGDGASANASVAEFNFGNPAFSISSGNADANGYGNFEYAVPSGYYAPCTKNLAKYG